MITDIALKQVDPAREPARRPSSLPKLKSAAVLHDVKKEKALQTEETKDSRAIPASTRRLIWKRDHAQCQYIDKITNKKCESKHAIQIDHIHPYSLGGSHHESNLRLLCRNHNQWRTRELWKN